MANVKRVGLQEQVLDKLAKEISFNDSPINANLDSWEGVKLFYRLEGVGFDKLDIERAVVLALVEADKTKPKNLDELAHLFFEIARESGLPLKKLDIVLKERKE